MSKKPEKELTFEQSLAALEESVRRLEDGDLDLAAALGAFESGIHHLKCCYARLEEAERRIELLSGVDRNGQAHVRPMPDQETSLEEKQQSRSGRRTHSPAMEEVVGDDLETYRGDSDTDNGYNVDGAGRLF